MWLQKIFQIPNLTKKFKKAVGRNDSGKITVRHRGGGIKSKEILINYYNHLWNIFGIVRSLEKHKLHNCYVASVYYPCGVNCYIIAAQNLRIGHIIFSGEDGPIKIGSTFLLKNIPLNIKIFNIESFPHSGGKFIRSPGNWAKILEKNNNGAIVIFKNGKKRKFSLDCCATIGRVSNLQSKKNLIAHKAGELRNRNIRPFVRGVAMNPVDHPHGGGKGKKSPKNPNYNFVRKLPKGRKTVLIKWKKKKN